MARAAFESGIGECEIKYRGVFPTGEPGPIDAIANRFELDPSGVDDVTYSAALVRAATTPSIRVP
jgi:hypothetical protein